MTDSIRDEYTFNELAEFFEFMDKLADLGCRRTLELAPLVRQYFGLPRDHAEAITVLWLQTWSPRVSAANRAERLFRQVA